MKGRMEGQRLLVGLHRRSASLRRSCGEDRFVALCDTLVWLEDLAHLGTSAFPVPWQGSLRMGREGKGRRGYSEKLSLSLA